MVQQVGLRKSKGRIARMEEAAKTASAVLGSTDSSATPTADGDIKPAETDEKDQPNPESTEPFDLQLLANFIHQVVNPLNGVAGILDNVIDGRVEGPGRAEQRLKAARAQLEQCISLVRNLAFFAQGFAALAPTDRRAVTVPQVIIEAAQVFQEQAANRGIVIDLLNQREQNKIFGHHELIRQIFMNLFDNAVKYSVPESQVVIEQRAQERREKVLITVRSQSARPLDQQDLKQIFELGFRGKNAREIVASGTGLGLYICNLPIRLRQVGLR
jgi:signal transduction histidine kinase